MSVCPCCGSELQHRPDPTVLLDSLSLGPTRLASLKYLATRMGQWTKSSDIANAVYAHDPNGGPITANKCVSILVCYSRGYLRGTGLAIEGKVGIGYRLVWDDAA